MEILSYGKINSTNLKAKELAKKGSKPWTIVLAKEQSSGYGKSKKIWSSPAGGLYFSVILPKSNIEDLQTLTILAAFIIAKVIKENFKLEPLIKLPNDVLLEGKKICGILTENVVGKDVKFSVMGIGLNTNVEKIAPELKNIATSIKMEIGKKVDNEKILKQIIGELKHQLKTISD